MVAPGDEDKERVDDPDAIFFQELGNGAIVADKVLNKIIDLCKRTDGAPETTQKQEDDRDERPPQHPGQGSAEIIMGGFGAKN